MRVTRKEFQNLKEEFHDTSFMAQRGMWHLMERRIRDARIGGMRESEHVVKEWNAMAEEEPCSVWNQVQKQVHTNQPKEIGEKPKRGINREDWEIRKDFTYNEAILGRCAYDFY